MRKSPATILKNKAVRILFFIFYLVFIYLLVLYAIQDDLFFYPEEKYISPSEMNMTEFAEVPLKSHDGVTVNTWFARRDSQKPVLLYFHGNTGQVARFAAPLLALIQNGYSVMMMEYRGFAQSDGKTNQKAMYEDATVAYDYLRSQGYSDIIAVGYSMGCAAAVGLAHRRVVSGLILLAPFESMEKMVSDLPIPFARYVLRDRYPSDEYIRDIYIPLLIFHGQKDRIIPYAHSERLYRLAGSRNKHLVLTPHDNHESIFFSGESVSKIINWLKQTFLDIPF